MEQREIDEEVQLVRELFEKLNKEADIAREKRKREWLEDPKIAKKYYEQPHHKNKTH